MSNVDKLSNAIDAVLRKNFSDKEIPPEVFDRILAGLHISMTTPDVLPAKYDPEEWQIEHEGRPYTLDQLSRNDLIQTAADGMEALERMNSIVHDAAAAFSDWSEGRQRNGTIEDDKPRPIKP